MRHARRDYDPIQDPRGIIPVDEPVFLLRGKDICVPAALQAWIKEAKVRGALPNIIESAEKHLQEIIEYQETIRELPDMPFGAGR